MNRPQVIHPAKRTIVICRPFPPSPAMSAIPVSYHFVDPQNLHLDSLGELARCFSDMAIEATIHRALGEAVADFPTRVTSIPDFVTRAPDADEEPRIALLVSSDTHGQFLSELARPFGEVLYLIPSRSSKDDGAAAFLESRGLPFIEIEYRATECPELAAFQPDYVFCGADWTSEFIAVQRILKDTEVPTIALQEGPEDWNMRFHQMIDGKRVLKIQNMYRNADVFFSQGAWTLGEMDATYFAITGNPKIAKVAARPLPQNPRILINCNFTYLDTKPAYEDSREIWMRQVLDACRKLKLDHFVSRHPRDDSSWDDEKLVPSSQASLPDQLDESSIVISRFSSVIYEALAMGRQAIYHNPHCEPMPTFSRDPGGVVLLSDGPRALEEALRTLTRQHSFDTATTTRYLERHCGPMDGRAGARITGLLGAIKQGAPDAKILQRGLNEISLSGNSRRGTSAPLPVTLQSAFRPKTVAIFCRNSANHYSGGRYHSWLLAEALAHAGHKVFYVTEFFPIFHSDFLAYPNHRKIELVLTKNYKEHLPEEPVDLVFVVPGMDTFHDFYHGALRFAGAKQALVALLCFESPNWFNRLSPVKRDPDLWRYWDETSDQCALILCSTRESVGFAREHFRGLRAGSRVEHCYPSINSPVADGVPDLPRERRIVVMARVGWADHKGSHRISELLGEFLRGYTLVFLVGSEEVSRRALDGLKRAAEPCGVEIELCHQPSDREKFRQLKRAEALLFPSLFEGFGLPPVEALYCGTPVISFDLPVIREVCGDGPIYVEAGNWKALRETLEVFVRSESPKSVRSARAEHVACFERMAIELNGVLESLLSTSSYAALRHDPQLDLQPNISPRPPALLRPSDAQLRLEDCWRQDQRFVLLLKPYVPRRLYDRALQIYTEKHLTKVPIFDKARIIVTTMLREMWR